MSELTFEQMLEESSKEPTRSRNDSAIRWIYEMVYKDVMKEVQGFFKVSDGYLNFWDANLNDREIKLG